MKRSIRIPHPVSRFSHEPVLLRLENVSAGYGGRLVLEDVSFSVRAGECVGIVGPNGSGKTTLLRVMTGSLPVSGGSAELEGRSLRDWSTRDRARVIAFVPQEHEGVGVMTVQEAVLMGRTPYLTPLAGESSRDLEVAAQVMDRLALSSIAERWLHTLSAGERQRVWMAMALAQEPKCLCLDEPTSHLDLRFQLEVMDQAAALRRDGMGVVWVSHDVNLAARYCTRLLLLSAGRVVADGPPVRVLTSRILRPVFGDRVGVERARDGGPILVPRAATAKGAGGRRIKK